MAYTVGEFLENNKPYNYFQFANNTHQLIIDMKGQLIKLQPLPNQMDASQNSQQITFIRGVPYFQHYRIDHDIEDKVILIFYENTEIVKFNYTSYFNIKYDSYQDIKIQW